MKTTRIAVAVLAAIASGAVFADFGDANVKINNSTATKYQEENLTIGNAWNLGLWNEADSAFVKGIAFDPTGAENYKGYVKNAGGTLNIGTLTLVGSSTALPTRGTLEFYPLNADTEDKTDKVISADSVVLGANSVLRIMKSNDSNTESGQNGNGKFIKGKTTIRFGEVLMNDKTGIGLSIGDAHQDNVIGMMDEIIIDHLTVADGSNDATIVSGHQNDKNAVVKIGTIDLNGNTLDLGGKNQNTVIDLAYDTYKTPTAGSTTEKTYKPIALASASADGKVRINMNSGNSKLVLGHLGDINAKDKTPVALDVNFNTEALTGKESGVSFGNGVEVVKGSTIEAIATDGVISGMTPEQTAKRLAGKVFTENQAAVAKLDDARATIAADGINEGYVYEVDTKTGEVDVNSVVVNENTTTHAFSQLAGVGYMQWRSAMNHMQYRMGELRDQKGYNNGAWVRVYNGKDKYGSQNVENTYFGFQAGYDRRIEGTNVLLGGAVSYTHGDSDFDFGEGDNYTLDFTAYGTWLADNGLFLDGTVKFGRLSNDITMDSGSTAGAGTASYDANAYSVSAEAGWRAALVDWAYVEPQAEIMYGRIDDSDYRFGDISVKNDSVETTVGRLGVQAGLNCPSKKGGAYVRASVLHDFDGESTTKFSRSGFGTTTIVEDMGDTWYELGIGAHYNVTESTYVYADFNYTDGGEVESPWRWSLGIRHAF